MSSGSRLLAAIVCVAALASCGSDESSSDDAVSLGADESSGPQPSSASDRTTCQGFVNIDVGTIQSTTVDAVRKAHPDAEAAIDGEQWVEVAVAGDWEGVGQAWATYGLSFALENSAGDNTYQIRGRAADLPDDAQRIESRQYFLVSDPIDELTLVCATANADWALGE